jgi:hypothetical protein
MYGGPSFVAYAVFGPLAFLSAYYVGGSNGATQAGRVVTMLVLLALAEPFLTVLPRRSASTPFSLSLLLFASWLVQPLAGLLAGDSPSALLAAREAFYAAIWCSSLWIVFLAIRGRDDLLLAIRLVDWLGIGVALSVYAAFVGLRFGVVLGDVQESEGALRVFGPLGDMVTYALLLFLFRELARGAWLRFAFFLPAFLFGRTRGALIALFVGLLAAGAFEVVRLARRQPLGGGRGRIMPLLVGCALVVASLLFSAPGRGLLERFAHLDPYGEDSASAARRRSIRLSWELFAGHPVLGIGPGGYARYVEDQGLGWSHEDAGDPSLPGTRRFNFEFSTAAQNQLSQLAAETGALGLVVFLAWSAVALRTLHRAAAIADPDVGPFFAGAELYAIAILVGTQSTCYLSDKSSIAYLLFLVIGLADRVVPVAVRSPRAVPASWHAALARVRRSAYASQPAPSHPRGSPGRA